MEGGTLSDQMLHVIVCALLASFGALAHFLNRKEQEPIHLFDIISLFLVASFTGVMVHFVTSYYEFQSNLAYLLAGISGWVGPQILDMISNMALKKTGLDSFINIKLPTESDFHHNENAK